MPQRLVGVAIGLKDTKLLHVTKDNGPRVDDSNEGVHGQKHVVKDDSPIKQGGCFAIKLNRRKILLEGSFGYQVE